MHTSIYHQLPKNDQTVLVNLSYPSTKVHAKMETRPTLFDNPRQQQSSTSDTLVLKAKYKWSPNGSTKVSKGKQSLQRTLTYARPCRGKSNCEDPCDAAEAGLLGTQYYLKRSSCFTVSILHCHYAACKLQRQVSFLIPKPRNRSLDVSSTLRSLMPGPPLQPQSLLATRTCRKRSRQPRENYALSIPVSHFLHLNFMLGVVFQGIPVTSSKQIFCEGLPCGADVVGPVSVSKCITKHHYGTLGEIFHLSRFASL